MGGDEWGYMRVDGYMHVRQRRVEGHVPHHAQQAQAQDDLGQVQAHVHRLRGAHPPRGRAHRDGPGRALLQRQAAPAPEGQVLLALAFVVAPPVAAAAATLGGGRPVVVVAVVMAVTVAMVVMVMAGVAVPASAGQAPAALAAAPGGEVDCELAAAEDEEDDGEGHRLCCGAGWLWSLRDG